MLVDIRALVTITCGTLDRLWRVRVTKPSPVLLPEWSDPLLPDLAHGAPSDHREEEARLRAQLAAAAAMLATFAPAAIREILRIGGESGRLMTLLALPGCAPWRVAGCRAVRSGADGHAYELIRIAGPGAPHAPHAVRMLRQTLRIGPVRLAPQAIPGGRCLSLDAALRDVILRLRGSNEPVLAAEVARIGSGTPGLLPSAA